MAQSSSYPNEHRASGNKRHGSRYKARRRAVDLLFEAEARDLDPVALVEERAAMARVPESEINPINEYTRQIVGGAATTLDALDDVIVTYLTDDWELNRIPATDRAILRVSVWELLFNPEVPEATAVVEGTELAFQYSGPQASAYINAMLDRVRKDLKVLRIQYSAEPQPDAAALADSIVGVDPTKDSVDTSVGTPAEAEPAVGSDADTASDTTAVENLDAAGDSAASDESS